MANRRWVAEKKRSGPVRAASSGSVIAKGRSLTSRGSGKSSHSGQHGQLVGAEVDDAVGNHQIEAGGLQRQVAQAFQGSLQERDVGEAKAFGVVIAVGLGHRQLLGGHVDPHHRAGLSHQLGKQVDVTTAAAAQIQHPGPVEQFRHHQAAAVVAAERLRMDATQQLPE